MEQDKNLRVVNGFAKVAKVFSMIGFVMYIVCGSLLLLTGLVITLFPFSKIPGMLTDLPQSAAQTLSELPVLTGSSIAFALIVIVAYAVVCKMSYNYFKRELNDGTPFTEGGAKQLRTLGIVKMAIEVALAVAGNFIEPLFTKPLEKLMPDLVAVMEEYGGTTVDLETALNALHQRSASFRLGTGFWLGLAFVALSFLLAYGAQLAERAGENERRTVVQPREDVWVPVEPHTEG